MWRLTFPELQQLLRRGRAAGDEVAGCLVVAVPRVHIGPVAQQQQQHVGVLGAGSFVEGGVVHVDRVHIGTCSKTGKGKEMFYLTTHSTHFCLRLYGVGYIVKEWDRKQ